MEPRIGRIELSRRRSVEIALLRRVLNWRLSIPVAGLPGRWLLAELTIWPALIRQSELLRLRLQVLLQARRRRRLVFEISGG